MTGCIQGGEGTDELKTVPSNERNYLLTDGKWRDR